MPDATTSDLLDDLVERDFEQVVLCRDPGSGLRSVIAVHDTTLGPALGGVRMRAYPSDAEALADALALARAMTYKAALAGLPLGGGKSVVNAAPTPENKHRLLEVHARYIATLGGRYVPGVDMGTTVEDLERIARWAPVVCSQRGDPSAYTARGVVRSIEAALPHAGLGDRLGGLRVAVQGLGSVGVHVTRLLAAAGAQLVVADVAGERVAGVVAETGAATLPADRILLADVDVLCPCAGGGVLTAAVADGMRARLVAGAANNVLSSASVAVALAARGIVLVPDFVANAGGLMAVEAELRGDGSGLDALVDGIAATTATVLGRAGGSGSDTLSVALALAEERLRERRADRPWFPATEAAAR